MTAPTWCRSFQGVGRHPGGYLDVRKRAIGHTVAYVGNLWGSLCDPRGIYAPALLVNAAYVVMFHTLASSGERARVERIRP